MPKKVVEFPTDPPAYDAFTCPRGMWVEYNTNRFEIGRDAYGHVQDIRPIGRSYVIWHTGNDYNFLGMRRAIVALSLCAFMTI